MLQGSPSTNVERKTPEGLGVWSQSQDKLTRVRRQISTLENPGSSCSTPLPRRTGCINIIERCKDFKAERDKIYFCLKIR